MIEIFRFIQVTLGDLRFWLREDLRRVVADRVEAAIGRFPEITIEEGRACYYIPDTDEVRQVMRLALVEGVIHTGQVEPRWNCYEAKLKLLRPLKISQKDRLALMKACEKQARPYRQRALEWLASTEEITDPLLRSFKQQLIQWDEDQRAGKQTYKLPLSEKQLIVLCDHVFRANPDWIAPAEEVEEPSVEIKRFDPWMGNTIIEKISAKKAEIEAARLDYYKRLHSEEIPDDAGAE